MENPTALHALAITNDLKPNFYCALTQDEMLQKIELFKTFFPAQIRDKPNCLSPEGLLAWGEYRTKNHLNKTFRGIEICYNHNWQKQYNNTIPAPLPLLV